MLPCCCDWTFTTAENLSLLSLSFSLPVVAVSIVQHDNYSPLSVLLLHTPPSCPVSLTSLWKTVISPSRLPLMPVFFLLKQTANTRIPHQYSIHKFRADAKKIIDWGISNLHFNILLTLWLEFQNDAMSVFLKRKEKKTHAANIKHQFWMKFRHVRCWILHTLAWIIIFCSAWIWNDYYKANTRNWFRHNNLHFGNTLRQNKSPLYSKVYFFLPNSTLAFSAEHDQSAGKFSFFSLCSAVTSSCPCLWSLTRIPRYTFIEAVKHVWGM